MTKRKSKGTQPPAPVVAKHKPLQALEEPARELFHIKKVYLREGPDAALETLRKYSLDGTDPSEASMSASGDIAVVARWIDQSESFRGRKPGAVQAETRYLEALVVSLSHEDTEGLWHALRIIVDNPDDSRNPTPGECPFKRKYKSGKPVIEKRGKVYPYGTFKNAVSKIRRARKSTTK